MMALSIFPSAEGRFLWDLAADAGPGEGVRGVEVLEGEPGRDEAPNELGAAGRRGSSLCWLC